MLLERMTATSGLSMRYLRATSSSASHRYKVYFIAKRSGGRRKIHHPSRQLKGLQRWLLQEVLSEWPVHDAAFAYRKGMSIAKHAAVHRGARFVLRMDFRDFFPSISVQDFGRYRKSNSGLFREWSGGDIEFFENVIFRFGELTIGAPTSPAFSNALCFYLDEELTAEARRQQCKYTRYADDLFFSCQRPEVLSSLEKSVVSIVESLSLPSDLELNLKKTRHSSRKRRQRITGVVLTSDGGISVGRNLKRTLSAMVHQVDKLGEKERERLAGMLAFVHGVEPDFTDRLIRKYSAEKVQSAQKPPSRSN